MDKYTFLSKLTYIEEELPKLTNTLQAMKVTCTSSYEKNYEALSLDASYHAEQIACNLRSLIFAANLVSRQQLMQQISDIQGIHITHTPEKLEIILPALIPKRTQKLHTAYLIEPLHAALSAYSQSNDLPHFSDFVVCFTHIYNKELSTRRIRDYDNLESKAILDMIGSFVLTDDSAQYCSVYHSTLLGDYDHTRITILPQVIFPKWLVSQNEIIFPMSENT